MDGVSFMKTEYGWRTCQCVKMNKLIFKNPIWERVPGSTLNRAMIKLTLCLVPSADTLPDNSLNKPNMPRNVRESAGYNHTHCTCILRECNSIAILQQNKRWTEQLYLLVSQIYHSINHPDWYVMVKKKHEF